MSDSLRPSPRYKPVSLFVTCIVDMVYPHTGISVVEILEHLGVEVRFPMAQTCCGQVGFNSGFWNDARDVAKQFLTAFADAEVIVAPSGSCASMVQHYYPELFKDEPEWLERAKWAASITWEFTEYLVDGLGITDIGAALPPTKVAFHDACHGLRLIGLKEQARALAGGIKGVEVTELQGHDQCCGFGGLFSVKMPEISNAMLSDKVTNIEAADADVIITGDASCLTQMNGGLSRKQANKRVLHIADLLARGLKQKQSEG
ncbi:MAG: (Fe-S)-binding protein [Anaerolineae bacterium]|nr:(Fe-S)-binding protein [Anaerolineae bacterium]MBN8620275.1 (Fe-S)-binding protein [Anaerolineae bacterium]